MKTTEHDLKHYYQPTNNTCGYTSLSMLLSHYGIDVPVDDLTKQVPQPVAEDGECFGSVTAQLVAWCVRQGMKTRMYSFDCLVLDLSWQGLSTDDLLQKLKLVRDKRDITALGGVYWSKVYVDAYIDMLEAGGQLTIQPYVTSKLIYKLLADGPVFANICSTTLRGKGRARNIGLRQSVVDDIDGTVNNHSVVIYGNDDQGNFLVADPWDGRIVIDPETMVCIITAAQIECDNQLFIIER